VSSLALEHGQSHFHYGPALPFEEDLFIDPLDPTNGMRDADGDGIYDVGGISTVTIWRNSGASKTFSSSYNGWYNTTIDIGVFEALTEYVIHVKATDNAANSLFYNYTVKGAFAGVLDFLKDIWNAVAGALNAVWGAVKSAVNFIIEWIKNAIINLLDPLIKSIVAAIQDWISRISMTSDSFLQSIVDLINGQASVSIAISSLIKLLEAIFGNFLYLILGLKLAIDAAVLISTVFSGGLGAIVSTLVIPMVIGMIFSSLAQGIDEKSPTAPILQLLAGDPIPIIDVLIAALFRNSDSNSKVTKILTSSDYGADELIAILTIPVFILSSLTSVLDLLLTHRTFADKKENLRKITSKFENLPEGSTRREYAEQRAKSKVMQLNKDIGKRAKKMGYLTLSFISSIGGVILSAMALSANSIDEKIKLNVIAVSFAISSIMFSRKAVKILPSDPLYAKTSTVLGTTAGILSLASLFTIPP